MKWAWAWVWMVGSAAAALDIPTSGDPVRLDFTSTTSGGWLWNNENRTSCDDHYGQAFERFNVNGSWGSWVAGLRLDASAFLYRPRAQPLAKVPCYDVELKNRYVHQLIPEKMWLGWRNRRWELTAGDSYVLFGRGLALSLRKSDELGVDTTQRGLRLQYSGERFSGSALAGFTNIGNLDEASGRSAVDPNDLLLGAQGTVQLAQGMRLGAHGVAVVFRQAPHAAQLLDKPRPFSETWLTAGPVLDAPALRPWLGLYVEGMVQQQMPPPTVGLPSPEAVATRPGLALYGSATVRAAQWTFLLEGKHYQDYQIVQPPFANIEFLPVQYATPPTLERVLQPQEHPQRNVSGGRLRADWALSRSFSFYLNDGLFVDREGYLNPQDGETVSGTIHDPYAGFTADVANLHLQGEGGYRFVYVNGHSREPVRGDGHVQLHATYGFGKGNSVEFHAIHWERSKVLPFLSEAWREGNLQWSYRRRPYFAVAATLDYTTETSQPQLWYPGGSFEWDFTASSYVRLFVGSSRGGLRCMSGLCRIFPPFVGAKASVVLRF